MTTTSENFFQKVWDFITGIFGKLSDEAKTIANVANLIVNAIKTLEANATFLDLQNLIIAIIEKEAPSLTSLIDGFFLMLPKIMAAILKITGEIDNDTLLQQFVVYLQGLPGIDGTLFSGILGALSAVIQAFFANNTGVANTDAQLLVSGQVIHQQLKAA